MCIRDRTYTQSFVVTNTGSFAVSSILGAGLNAPYDYLGGVFPGTGGDCGTTLAPTATCTIVVEFAPTATGIQADTIDVTYFDGAVSQVAQRDVTGDSVLPALLEISDAPTFNYGTVATNSVNSKTFTLTNSGAFQATSIADGLGLVAPFQWAGGGAFPGAGGTCAASLAVAAVCTVVV